MDFPSDICREKPHTKYWNDLTDSTESGEHARFTCLNTNPDLVDVTSSTDKSQTKTYKHIKSSGCVMLISQTWHAHKRKDTNLFEQKQQQEHIGRSNWTGEFHKNIFTKHMCFTVESGPRYTETRTKTTSRAIFGIHLHHYEKSKTKSRRKARIVFHQFQDVRSGMATCDP